MGQRCIRYKQRRMRTNNAFVGKAIDRQEPKREQALGRAGKEKFLNRRTPTRERPAGPLTGVYPPNAGQPKRGKTPDRRKQGGEGRRRRHPLYRGKKG